MSIIEFKNKITQTQAYINAEKFKQKLIVKNANIEKLQDLHRQALKYGIDYVKHNPNVSVGDRKLIEDLL